MIPAVKTDADQLTIHFDTFDIETYRKLFLRVKRLPEYALRYHDDTGTYTVTAPARFAGMLGVDVGGRDVTDLPIARCLFDDQRHIVSLALDAKRFAVWADCGLGKTPIGLEWSRHVIHQTGGRVLIITLNEIVEQTIEECRKFYGETGDGLAGQPLAIVKLSSRRELREWCAHGTIDGEPTMTEAGDRIMLAITNYEKMNPDKTADPSKGQVVNELRNLAGIWLDESSRLKTGGGKQKWAIIKSSKGIAYKLSTTATPAPNDTMEFASQASFLEKMRSEGEIIWTYFTRDPKTHRWSVKKHARKAFFEFMSGWSIYVRDPQRYGWRIGMPKVPEPIVKTYELTPTEAQQAFIFQQNRDAETGQLGMFADKDVNTIQRNRLGQVAKGFLYESLGGSKRRVRRIESDKPGFVVDLIRKEVERGLQVLVWTVYDAETDILADLLKRDAAWIDVLTGKVPKAKRLPMLERFRRGESKVLVSRAAMLGYGMNFQHCGSMIFSGFNDSYEQFYQAIRRAFRHGQKRRLRVHIPFVRDLEEQSLETILHKQDQHEAAIEEMERNYISAMGRIAGSGKDAA